jgi:SagB-type dehydrogenase family enzyme
MIGEKFIKKSSLKIDVKIKPFKTEKEKKKISLIKPIEEDFFIELINRRRSIREYSNKPLTIEQLSFILYSAYGVTGEKEGVKLRAVPSAGAKYPIEIYVSVFNVENLDKGLYKFDENSLSLTLLSKGDFREDFLKLTLEQDFIKDSSIMIIMVARSLKSTYRYGERGIRYVLMDASYISENIYLASSYLSLGTCAIGAFIDDGFKEFLRLKGSETFMVIAQTIGTLK